MKNALKPSDTIRELALDRYVRPALRAGKKNISIAVRQVLTDLGDDFRTGRTPMVCQVLKGGKLLTEGGLEIERIDGPPSKQSPTVIFHYRVVRDAPVTSNAKESIDSVPESPEARAERVVNGLRGILKDEIASFGGAEAFMRWVRSEDEDEAA